MGGEELKWLQPVHHKLKSQQGPHFSPHSTAKTNDKSMHSSGIMVSSGISDVVIASVQYEMTRLKKLVMMKNNDDDYYYEYIARNDGF